MSPESPTDSVVEHHMSIVNFNITLPSVSSLLSAANISVSSVSDVRMSVDFHDEVQQERTPTVAELATTGKCRRTPKGNGRRDGNGPHAGECNHMKREGCNGHGNGRGRCNGTGRHARGAGRCARAVKEFRIAFD